MKLYSHPFSTTCRPVLLFIADQKLEVEIQNVDIMAGEQFQPAFAAVNPNGFVPVLEDGTFRLTESSAILKYLADKISSPTYPKELQQRARVNEVMDWFNTNFYRSFGYGLCYGQLLDPYKLPDASSQLHAVNGSKRSTERLLGILNDHIIGSRAYLCGDAITIADYFASGIISLGEVIGCKFASYPNVARWYQTMRDRPNWRTANAGVQTWADFVRGPAYVTV
jgi:glutathione S-transferase